jgi:hypothetical protein
LLVGVGVLLGTTVFRDDIANATGLAGPPMPVSIVSPLDSQGNVKVHEQGTANVSVGGVVTTQQVTPSHSFSVRIHGTGGEQIVECQGSPLPAGTRWFITSFGAANTNAGAAFAQLVLAHPASPSDEVGPALEMQANNTAQMTFPQPFVMTATDVNQCLSVQFSAGVETVIVGYRQ